MAFLLDAMHERLTFEKLDRFRLQTLHESGYVQQISNEWILQSPIASCTSPPTYYYLLYNTYERFTSTHGNFQDALLTYQQKLSRVRRV